MYLKHVITAGILSAALAIGPGSAFAQTSGSSSAGSQNTSSQGTSSQTGTTTTSSSGSSTANQGGSGSSGADQEAVRQHLGAAREALAELTKLPAASQLQGDQRQQVANLISNFNAFATATTDWRPKYDTIDRELDQILGLGGSASGSASASAAPSSAGASSSAGTPTGTTADASSAGTSGAAGSVGTGGEGSSALDPTIVAKLSEVRKHLDGFEEASGDPTFVVEKIEKILDQAAGGASGSSAVGTSGSTGGGSVTLTAEQVQEVRRQLGSIKAAAKR